MAALLNAKHERFAQELAKGKTADEAYQIAGYKRYINVVGLERAVRTMNRQAAMLDRIASALDMERTRERTAFADTIIPIVTRAKQSALATDKNAADLAREAEKLRAQNVLVELRKTNVEAAQKELAGHQATMAQTLAQLRGYSNSLYNVRVNVRDATVLNQEHERSIRNLEGWRWLPFVGGRFIVNKD
jgi:hypothetical protein